MPLTLSDDTLSRASAAAFSAKADADVWGLGFNAKADRDISDLSLPDDTQSIAGNPLPIMVSPQPQVQWPQPRAPQPYTQPDAENPGQVVGSNPTSGAGEAPLLQSSSAVERPGAPVSPPVAMPSGGSGAFASNDERLAYVADAARRYGHDPSVAQAVARSEGAGPAGTVGDQGTSFGAFQAHVGGGQGDDFRQQTGLDPSDPANERALIDWQMRQVGQTGWTPFHGAAAVGIGPWQGVGTGQMHPNAPQPTPSGRPEEVSSDQRAGSVYSGSYTQQGLADAGDPDAWAKCGPVAAFQFAQRTGRNPTPSEVERLARDAGWTPQRGMAGFASEAAVLQGMGIAARSEQGVNWDKVITDVSRGNPVILQLPGHDGHYITAQSYDAQTGKIDFGSTVGDLRAAGHKTQFTPSELEGLGWGTPNASLYVDNPATPAPSAAAGASAPTAASSPSDAASPAAPAVAGSAQPAAAGALDPLRDQLGASSGGVVNYRQSLQQPADEPSPAGGAPTIGGVPILPQPESWQMWPPTVYPPLVDQTIGPYPSGIQTVQGSTTNPIRNQAVRGDPPDEYGDRSFAPGGRVQYRQPLAPTLGPDTATGADVPYDPRQYDQGAHETGYTVGGAPDPSATVPTGAPAAVQLSSNGAAGPVPETTGPASYGQAGDQPQTPAYTPPVPQQTAESPLKPLYDLAGQVIGYVHTAAEAAGQAMAAAGVDNPTPEEQAQRASVAGLAPGEHFIEPPHVLAGTAAPVQSTQGEPDYVPRPGLMDIVGQNTGFAASQRMHQIEANAAAAQGIVDPVRAMRAPSDPAWRAQNPEMAQEYDDLQQQLAFVVGGTFGTTSGGEASSFAQQMQAAQARYQQARLDLVRASDSLREAQVGGLPSEVRQWQRVVDRAQTEHAAALSQIDAVRATAPAPQWANPEMEPSFRSDVGARYPDIRRDVQGSVRQTLGEPSAEMLADSRYPRDAVNPDIRQNMGPPLTEAPDMGGRMNAQAGPQAVGAADNLGRQAVTTVGNFARGAMTGGVGAAMTDPGSPQGEQESDADYAARRARERAWRIGTAALATGVGFAGAGALMRRGGGGALQMAGPQGQGPALPPGIAPPIPSATNLPPAVQQAVQQGQARMGAGRTGLDWLQYWARRWGGAVSNASLLGPSSFVAKGTGDLSQLLIAGLGRQPTVALARGAPQEYGQFLAGTFNALDGMGTKLIDTIAARGAYADPRSLSGELQSPGLKGLATMLEVGARAGIGAPTTLFRELALGGATQLRAAQAATDAVRAGLIPKADWANHIQAIMADVEHVRAGGQPTLPITQHVIDSAEAYAQKQTFTNEVGPIGEFIKRFSSGRVWGPNHNQPTPIVSNFLLPYFNVPWNLKATLAEHSPIGLAQGLADVAQGKGTQIERTEKVFNGMLGSAVLLGMGSLATNGVMTGKGPSDQNELQALKNSGWQPYHTLVNGVYVPNRLVWGFAEPAANMAGDVHDAIVFRKPGTPIASLPVAGDALQRLGADLLKDSFMQPLADGLSMINPTSQASATTRIARYAASQVDRFAVPYASWGRTIGTAMDPNERVADRGPNAPLSDQFGQQVRLGIGNRQGFPQAGEGPLPVAQNRYGQPIANTQQGLLAPFSKISPQRSDPLSAFYSGYSHNLGPSPSRIAAGGETIPLTPNQQRTWEQYRGEQLNQARLALQNDRYWQAATPQERDQIIQNQFRLADTAATNRIKGDIGDAALGPMIEDAKRQKAIGR